MRLARPAVVVGSSRLAGGAATAWTAALIEEPLRGHPYVCPVAAEDACPLVYQTDLLDGLRRLYQAVQNPSRLYHLAACTASAGELAQAVRIHVPNADIRFQPDPIARLVIRRFRYLVQDSQLASRELGWQPRYATPAAFVTACRAEIGIGAGGATADTPVR